VPGGDLFAYGQCSFGQLGEWSLETCPPPREVPQFSQPLAMPRQGFNVHVTSTVVQLEYGKVGGLGSVTAAAAGRRFSVTVSGTWNSRLLSHVYLASYTLCVCLARGVCLPRASAMLTPAIVGFSQMARS